MFKSDCREPMHERRRRELYCPGSPSCDSFWKTCVHWGKLRVASGTMNYCRRNPITNQTLKNFTRFSVHEAWLAINCTLTSVEIVISFRAFAIMTWIIIHDRNPLQQNNCPLVALFLLIFCFSSSSILNKTQQSNLAKHINGFRLLLP
eukprot:IDg10872t1